jgi:2Fe-2S ferredoxin
MTTIKMRTADGHDIELHATGETSLMQLAKSMGVPGIDADCGGSMVCGTCHVHVASDWLERLPAASEMEQQILECVPLPDPAARLSCQIQITQALDGLSVRIPERQR